MKKFISVVCLLFVFLMVVSIPVGAARSYQTYTYSIDGFALASPHAYSPKPDGSYDSFDIGLVEKTGVKLKNPSDLFVGPDNSVYIADTDNNRIVVLDEFYKFKFAISAIFLAASAASFPFPEIISLKLSKNAILLYPPIYIIYIICNYSLPS